MQSVKAGLFGLMALLAMTILGARIASADCGPSVSKYGPCSYRGDLLFCGSCAFNDSGSGVSGCNRCGAGYLCKSNGCSVLSRCADEYRCDLCGCSWRALRGFSRQRAPSSP
jgi:hypothetical protein